MARPICVSAFPTAPLAPFTSIFPLFDRRPILERIRYARKYGMLKLYFENFWDHKTKKTLYIIYTVYTVNLPVTRAFDK